MKTDNSLTAWYASIKLAGEAKPLQAISIESKPRRPVNKPVIVKSSVASQASVDVISSFVFK